MNLAIGDFSNSAVLKKCNIYVAFHWPQDFPKEASVIVYWINLKRSRLNDVVVMAELAVISAVATVLVAIEKRDQMKTVLLVVT